MKEAKRDRGEEKEIAGHEEKEKEERMEERTGKAREKKRKKTRQDMERRG